MAQDLVNTTSNSPYNRLQNIKQEVKKEEICEAFEEYANKHKEEIYDEQLLHVPNLLKQDELIIKEDEDEENRNGTETTENVLPCLESLKSDSAENEEKDQPTGLINERSCESGQFPENAECLRFLVRLCSDLGMREAQDYLMELKKLEKAKEVRERVNSSRPGSRRSNSGLSSRAGSGFSPVMEHDTFKSPPPLSASTNRNLRSTRALHTQSSAGSSDSGIGHNNIDVNYSDPLGPLPVRPRTGAGKPFDFEDFGNGELGDDLLPE